ncbi:MAG: DNRLRE domain-containing protein [Gammaproteobacteria bacterium]
MIRGTRQNGYILLPVVILLTLVATVAFTINHESALDSGITSSQLEAKQAEAVAMAGINHALWQTRQQGCGPYTDLTNKALDNHSYTTTLTTDLGSTNGYTISVDQDTWIRSDQPTNNYSTDSKLHIRYEGGIIERPMYRYDLSPIPAGSNILSATAWFYVSKEHPQGPVDIHRLNADWTETDATWDSMGAKMDPMVQATIPTQAVADVWVAVNLTSQVQAWVNGEPNYGITLNSLSEGTHGDYASHETGQQPYLEVVVGTPPSSPAMLKSEGKLANGISRTIKRDDIGLYQQPSHRMLQLQPGAGKDTMLSDFYNNRNYGDHRLRVSLAGSLRNALVQFDVAAIPLGARVISAQLQLYHTETVTAGIDAGATVHRVKRDWVEGTKSGTGTADGATWDTWDGSAAWGTAGGDYDPAAIASSAITAAIDDWESWDITTLVQGWVDGSFYNNGLLLRGSGDVNISFASKENADATLHPKLIISYACECGTVCSVPQGSGNILFVVSDEWYMTAGEKAKRALFESWGYTVDLISQWDVSWNFDAKAVNNDVVYVSEAVISTTFGMAPKLAATTLGVVNEEGDINDELGISSASAWPVGDSFTIKDNSHYITWPFAIGGLQIFSAAMEGLTVSGSEAAGLQTLADGSGNKGSLVVLDTGAVLDGGGTAPGRRVMLPLGKDNTFNLDYLNLNGRLIVQRALAWGMRADITAAGNQLLLVVADDTSLTSQEDAKKSLIESWGYVVKLIDDSESQTAFDTAVAANNVVFVSGDVSAAALGTKLRNTSLGVVNERIDLVDEFGFAQDHLTNAFDKLSVVDNTHDITTGFATGWLTVTTSSQPLQALDGTLAPGLQSLAEVWITGANYDEGLAVIDTDAALYGGGTAAGRRAQLPWGSSGFNISALNSNGQTIMQRAIEWAKTPPEPKAPIAHWKLDETGGLTAVDSAGGHDGTLVNDPVWAGGQHGGALNFDGSNDHINVPHDDTLSLNDAMTFATWINASSFGNSYQTIIAKDGGGSASNYWFGTWRQELAFGFFASGSFREVFTTGLNLQPNTWYHVAVTFDNAADEVVLYVDGVPVHKDAMTFSPSTVSADLTIGRSPDGEYWRGRLDDVRIYDELLSVTEIAGLAAPPVYTPIAHWKLDETGGDTAVDSIGGHDGTLVNGPVWTAGHVGGGLTFDGNNDTVDVGADASLDDLFASGATITAWIHASGWGEGNFGRIADKADNLGSNRNGWAFEVHGANRALLFQYGFTDNIGNWYTPVDSIALDTWHHVAVVYDKNAHENDPVIYIDGVAQTLVELDTPVGTASSDAGINLTLGNYALDTSRTFDGILDDIRIYDQMLDASEIASLAAESGSGGGSPLTGCDGTFRDEFSLQQYDQNNGTLSWATDWEETGETTNPTGGDIYIASDTSNFQLVLQDDGQTVMREADLSNAGNATLSFDYRRQDLSGSGDYVAIEISYNGGTNWTELDRFTGTATDTAYTSTSYVLDAGALSANTRIRFLTPGNGMNNNNKVWFDNVQIQCSP